MVYPNNKLWGLAVSAVITEIDNCDHYWIGGRGPSINTKKWCYSLLSDYYRIDSRKSALRSLKYFFQHGHTAEAKQILASLSNNPATDNVKQQLVRDASAQIDKHGLLAWDMARAVMVAGRSYWCDYLSENEAWEMILTAAAKVQKSFSSWRAFAVNYELGRLFWSQGNAHGPTEKALDKLLTDPQSPWNRLPFDTALGIELIEEEDQAKIRIKKTVCPECGALKTNKSLTAYVYCDYCGSLADYDFQKAKENPAAQPGPVYQQLVAEMQPILAQAKAAGDKSAYRKAQKKLFRAWVDACPNAIPPRAKEPEYRKQYISFLARSYTAGEFDAQAQKLQAEVQQAMASLQWAMTDGGAYRVGSAGWEQLCKATFAHQIYMDKLCLEKGIYERFPDKTHPDIPRRIGNSLFVQAWLPMITEDQAKVLLERTGLVGEYITVDALSSEESSVVSCVDCGAKLTVPANAKKTVCEYCGHTLDSAAPTIPCPGCNSSFSPTLDGTATNCPYCKTEVRRIN